MSRHWSDYVVIGVGKSGNVDRGSVYRYDNFKRVLFQGCIPIYDTVNVSAFWEGVVATCKEAKADYCIFSDAYWGERSEMYELHGKLLWSGKNPKGPSVYRTMEEAPEDITKHLIKSPLRVNPNSTHVIRVFIFNAKAFFEEKANETGL
jgi:hypothetical protein